MPREPKEKPDDETAEESSYYYDDSHGYEDFDPEAEDEETKDED